MGRKNTGRAVNGLGAQNKRVVSTISHTIRTPLSIIKEGLSLLLDEIPGKLNPQQKKIVTVAKNNIDRLTQSIEELLRKEL